MNSFFVLDYFLFRRDIRACYVEKNLLGCKTIAFYVQIRCRFVLLLSDIIIFINNRAVKRVEKKRHSNELKVSHNERIARRMRERFNLDWRFRYNYDPRDTLWASQSRTCYLDARASGASKLYDAF